MVLVLVTLRINEVIVDRLTANHSDNQFLNIHPGKDSRNKLNRTSLRG
jgi:hypothetical protein